MKHQRLIITLGFLVCLLIFVGYQFVITWEVQQRKMDDLTKIEALRTTDLSDEKIRQELISLRLENEQRTIFLQDFITNISVAAGLLIALIGAYITVNQYVDVREKERTDRAAANLSAIWEGITSSDKDRRAGSIADLRQFLSPDKEEFHDQVASALALAGRLDNEDDLVIRRTLTPIIETAMKVMPSAMKKVSWQGLYLSRCDFSEQDLTGFDFRDAILEQCDFHCAKLTNARFDAARLISTNFDEADLTGAKLEFADLANASFRNAKLNGADIRNIGLLGMDLQDATLTDAKFSPFSFDWRLAKNWRSATFDSGIKDKLLERFGPQVTGLRVLILLWEFPPNVLGGTWTAAFHTIHNLRRQGANLIVMVPWLPSSVSYQEFGNEIQLIAVGEEPRRQADKSVDMDAYSSYSWLRASRKIENELLQNSYDTAEPSKLQRLENDFKSNALRAIESHHIDFDVIHAQDWLTFPAAEALADCYGKPWVAHFHSTENERRAGMEINNTIRQIEINATRRAENIVVPSDISKKQLVDCYNVPDAKVIVIPNSLSPGSGPRFPLGQFHTSTVAFLGRLSYQKGPDIFVDIAYKILDTQPQTRFEMYGKGEMEGELSDMVKYHTMPEPEIIEGQDTKTSRIQFSQIQSIDFDSVGNRISLLGSGYTERKRNELEKMLIERGFTANALVDDNNWTHRIRAKDLADGFHLDYLVVANGLRTILAHEEKIYLEQYLDWSERWRAFNGISVLVVPSRAEPFGMVILEAMQAGVPVVFSKTAGAGEVLASGIRADIEQKEGFAQAVVKLLEDEVYWQHVVDTQLEEVKKYPERGYEICLSKLWNELHAEQSKLVGNTL